MSKHPSVFVVDSHATRPPLPPRVGQKKQRAGAAQTLMFMLVSLALCGMAIEACLIYRLYQLESADSASSSKIISGDDAPTIWPRYGISPSKPVAHLTGGDDVVHKQETMAWSMIADPLLYEMTYKDGGLIIQKEGYYYVYSKILFKDNGNFHHTVTRHTIRYAGGSIPLLQSRIYSSNSKRSNSYLGGVFHLYKDDTLYVIVSNTTRIDRNKAYENIFGVYMI
ncbi:tumor necrosis factor ligand superfamily member 14 [Seriola aureovittata]|uniref:tumor necrosis factor ligand superfamily member 14 n=1 Tax=Seriola aureovittata TaxID=2871759 RepID=UPI0024BDF8E0|nr:tumor necrosis factor ligand superfamily member 14 [Seriola aureovittata]XP_056256407.1 tumor necrosis factor ligand superfamily member 14 [Seriola aureovittata]XP_056256408.1 tumor necrosis factor ligand superfamily member 14 [Seriola aureovittata]XP_056256409.1 tumor necrosis factor ligand superfamily member 14 [Seriola aureovittata]